MKTSEMNTSSKCDICLKDCNDPVEYGEIFEKSRIKVHYYCLLTSTHLPQRGENIGGILGFLLVDIKKEIKEAASRFCCYCKERNASIKCSSCDVYFHLKCALEKDCLVQFLDEFKSYCHKHHNIKHSLPHTPQTGCFICREKMGNYNPLTSITSDCCSTNAWVHRKCLKIYALAAGYYLKCLWCTSTEFRDYVRLHGIFVPDRDAAWEKMKGAYSELYEKIRKKCMALKCICPFGKEFKSRKWNIEVCTTCGAFAIHKLCRYDETSKTEFVCKTCKKINTDVRGCITLLSRSVSFDTSLFMPKSQRPIYSIDACSVDLTQQNVTMNHEDLCMISSDSEEELNSLESGRKEEIMIEFDETQTDKCIKVDNQDVLFVYDKNTLKVLGFLKSSDIKDERDFDMAFRENETLEEKIILVSQEHSEADKFLEELIEEHLQNKKTDPEIIVSDSDSDVSASKLLDKLERKDNIPVPKPKVFSRE